jgi:hypothetical protein
MNPDILIELELIRSRDPNGILYPERVVEFARDVKTALHSQFDWDVQRAAQAHWLEQARRIIRVNVRLLEPSEGTGVIRAFVSVSGSGDKGYQSSRVVLRSPTKRRELIESILDRFESTLHQHQLAELEPIQKAVDDVRASFAPKRTRVVRKAVRKNKKGPPDEPLHVR